ncbi:MAG: SDR family oxidoreductase [Gammaproteobacteria bacterium]|nr:SDR family oxidoreductase [Gammaproteobacteria bacterium]
MSDARDAVLVSGAGGGIGTALCSAFRAAGYRVIATDSAKRDCDCDEFVALDLANFANDEHERRRFSLAVETARAGANLRVIVNNAAVQILGAAGEVPVDALRHSLDVNVSAPYGLVACFIDSLARHGGVVLNIGSVHAQLTKPGFFAYGVSKAALAGLTRSMALDLAPRGIRVNEIRPGATATPMLLAGFSTDPQALAEVAGMQPLGRLGQPSEIAAMAVFLASRQAAYVTGAAIQVDGGISARLHDPR